MSGCRPGSVSDPVIAQVGRFSASSDRSPVLRRGMPSELAVCRGALTLHQPEYNQHSQRHQETFNDTTLLRKLIVLEGGVSQYSVRDG